MFWINLVIGAVLILVGWLCYRNPNLINPYGGMSPERKALVDIEGLKWALAIIMTVAGGLIIFTGLLSAFRVISEETSSTALRCRFVRHSTQPSSDSGKKAYKNIRLEKTIRV